MKTISIIAKECSIDRSHIDALIKREKIIKDRKFIDKYQEDIIHQILYFEGKIEFITLESKMNKEITFEEFKQKTYGKTN